jgi:hypothetical protein
VLKATPDSINPGGTTTVEATVYDASGNPVSGVSLTFTLDNPLLASITSTVATNGSGVAKATLTARSTAGTIQVTATSDSVSSSPLAVAILSSSSPSQVSVTVNPTAIRVQGTTTVQAQVLGANGQPVPDGTVVTFTSENQLFGTFSSNTASTNSGTASATFQAADQAGTASISVSSGLAVSQANITVLPALASVIQFVSANPQIVALKGSGGVETSVVQFVVKDNNDNPVEGINVSLSLTGPNGGEYIDPPPDTTPKQIDVSTDANGIAQVILHSGGVAGPTTIIATTYVSDGTGSQIPIQAQSSVISIGGGVPSAGRFSVAATQLNLPGLDYDGIPTTLMVYLADRFGNYNVLTGTTVSFATEPGLAVDAASVTTDATGVAQVTARTQIPQLGSGPEQVQPLPWETQFVNYVASTYGVSINPPREGLVSVLVYVRGEEQFNDTNANGVYDLGTDSFTDTIDDPFIDYNDNGVYDGPSSADPMEQFIDSNGNGVWNTYNGKWDADKFIFYNFKILLTSEPIVRANVSTFTVPNGGSTTIKFLVCDVNGNIPTGGSTLSVSTDNGTLRGTTHLDYTDSSVIGSSEASQLGLVEFVYTLSDSDPTTDDPKQTTVTASLSWNGGPRGTRSISRSVIGTVH